MLSIYEIEENYILTNRLVYIHRLYKRRHLPDGLQGCWIWTGAHDKQGRGHIMLPNRRTGYVPRVSYILHNGPIGDLHALHKCDNPACFNPTHLFAGTDKDNCDDRATKGKTATAKLTPDDIAYIRTLLAAGVKQAEIARRVGVHRMTITHIKQRNTHGPGLRRWITPG